MVTNEDGRLEHLITTAKAANLLNRALEQLRKGMPAAGQPTRQSFYHRKKDDIWVGIILAVAAAIFGAVVMVLVN